MTRLEYDGLVKRLGQIPFKGCSPQKSSADQTTRKPFEEKGAHASGKRQE